MRIAAGSTREPKLAGVRSALERFAGRNLASVVDGWAAGYDVRSRQGAFGVLTAGLVNRADAYAQAVLTALAPFYAPGWSASGRGTRQRSRRGRAWRPGAERGTTGPEA